MTTNSLVQIEPLSQSKFEQMACGYGYRAVHVHHRERAGSIWSDFGQEAHQVLSMYVEHLVETRQATDYDYFDGLIEAVQPEILEELDRVRDSLVIDPERVLGTEQYIGLDENFSLVVMEHVAQGHRSGGDPRIAYEGTLDLVLLNSSSEAEIPDWKNQFQITPPDTFQAKFYPLLLFCALPSVEVIHFRLEYLRWGACRSITFTRKDLPRLKRMAAVARNRQRKLMRAEKEPRPTPHRGCIYCPLLLKGCPIETANPYARLSAAQRLRLQIYLDAAQKVNQPLLKQWAQSRPISVKDANGARYTASFIPRRRTRYGLDAVLPLLDSWDKSHPDDPLRPHLTVGTSELNDFARAHEKRPRLAESLSAVAEVTPYTEFQISVEASRTGTGKPKSGMRSPRR